MDDPISVGVEGKSHPVLCGLCRQPVTRRAETNPETGQEVFGCTACDNWADRDQLVAMVAEYVKDEGQMILNRMMRDAAKKSRIMTFTGKTQGDKLHRFIVDLQI